MAQDVGSKLDILYQFVRYQLSGSVTVLGEDVPYNDRGHDYSYVGMPHIPQPKLLRYIDTFDALIAATKTGM